MAVIFRPSICFAVFGLARELVLLHGGTYIGVEGAPRILISREGECEPGSCAGRCATTCLVPVTFGTHFGGLCKRRGVYLCRNANLDFLARRKVKALQGQMADA